MKRIELMALILSVMMSGCGGGGGGAAKVCEPGETQKCLCVAGGEGAQSCRDDGTGWTACMGCPGEGGDASGEVSGPGEDTAEQPLDATQDSPTPEDAAGPDTDDVTIDTPQPEVAVDTVTYGDQTCGALTQCALTCQDQACVDACVEKGTQEAQTLFAALYDCVAQVCAGEDLFDQQCVMGAAIGACSGQYGTCTSGGEEQFECEEGPNAPTGGCLDDDDACSCLGCQSPNGCDPKQDDCVCPGCASDSYCINPMNCNSNGKCDPYNEGCKCADCEDHPLCAEW